jgi:hypothetical protein
MLREISYYRNEPFCLNKNFPYCPQNSILFSQFWAFLPYCTFVHIGHFKQNFSNQRSNSHYSDVFGSYWENIDFGYRLLISFLRVIRPSDFDLKYHFGLKMLEYDFFDHTLTF